MKSCQQGKKPLDNKDVWPHVTYKNVIKLLGSAESFALHKSKFNCSPVISEYVPSLWIEIECVCVWLAYSFMSQRGYLIFIGPIMGQDPQRRQQWPSTEFYIWQQHYYHSGWVACGCCCTAPHCTPKTSGGFTFIINTLFSRHYFWHTMALELYVNFFKFWGKLGQNATK